MEILKKNHIDEEDKKGCTALFNACWYGDSELASILIELGADPFHRIKFFGNIYAICGIFKYHL